MRLHSICYVVILHSPEHTTLLIPHSRDYTPYLTRNTILRKPYLSNYIGYVVGNRVTGSQVKIGYNR
uniref:Putative ovule protein n=1 Tax=Solanum chacoense TaxID=4108 RepID=A0A0V0HVL1_SOLCH